MNDIAKLIAENQRLKKRVDELTLAYKQALESVQEQPAQQEPDPDELTIAYMSGLYDGKKRKPWVGLTKQEENELCDKYWRAPIRVAILAVEEKLMEKNQ